MSEDRKVIVVGVDHGYDLGTVVAQMESCGMQVISIDEEPEVCRIMPRAPVHNQHLIDEALGCDDGRYRDPDWYPLPLQVMADSLGSLYPRRPPPRNNLTGRERVVEAFVHGLRGKVEHIVTPEPLSKRRKRRLRGKERQARQMLPDGLWESDGRLWFSCGNCDETTEWHGDTADFELGYHANVCGRSPRCCP